MRPIHTFTVVPSLPPQLELLRAVAYDLHWAWNHDAIELFRRLDRDLWEESGHNPVRMLGTVGQARLERLAADPAFLAHLSRVAASFESYRTPASTWFERTHGADPRPLIAYFSAEFGITECLSVFAGGLGILAGDHLKSASDLGIPLVGVGLLYQQGYFRQRLNEAGWQQEVYEKNDFFTLPVTEALGPDGNPVVVGVPFPGEPVMAKVWRAQVGRVDLFLLDTNVPQNALEDRAITFQLYGGDRTMRLRQELVLGIGGVRALTALGLQPSVFHMNEGHSAFLVMERVKSLMEEHGLDQAQAREVAGAELVFTTHTPVAAGHDYFPPELIERYLGEYARACGVSTWDLLALGRVNPNNPGEEFCATVLALRCAGASNGVSRLHGAVSRSMWKGMWPDVPQSEIPIGSVTNGVHFESWISQELTELYDRYLGPEWRDEPASAEVWARAHSIPPEELWRTQQRRRERLVVFARRRLRAQLLARGAPLKEVDVADVVLDPHALTIGFSRRFATYKRATLLLRDPERLSRILNDPDRPVQIIYAGKAHPQDDAGKELIKEIIALTRRPGFRPRVVFVQDYDMAVTRYLVQGCDVWLNTPVRPLEASGTSGMKAAANGALNLSTLDGWWDEAYRPGVGWAIGRAESYEDAAYRDSFEADALYDLLERDVVPTFYERGPDNLPRAWVRLMQTSIATLNHEFNTHRMVREYAERFYLPAAARAGRLAANDFRGARGLAEWKARVTAAWPAVKVAGVANGFADRLRVGEPIDVRASVHLAGLSAEDVRVELYLGRIDPNGELLQGSSVPMTAVGEENGLHVFGIRHVAYTESGLHGLTVRVLPHHPDLATPFLPGLIAWA
jgi:starch phosphorylase